MEGPSVRPSDETEAGRRRHSVLERYHRLTPGRRPRAEQHGRETEFSSTTRSLLSHLYSGELPSPEVSLHLSSEAQEQLRRSREVEEIDLFPSNDHASERDSDDEWDLFIQNKNWLTAIPPTTLGPSDVRYRDDADEISEEEDRLDEASPFQNRRPPMIPPIREDVSTVEQPTTERTLVELARDGRFAELWYALKMARQNQIEDGTSEGTLYYSAGDTFISEWTTYTSRRGLIIKDQNSYHTAMDISIGSSFETCETYFDNDSEVDSDRQNSSVQLNSLHYERHRQLKRLITERAKQKEREEGRRKRIVAITRIPRELHTPAVRRGRGTMSLSASGAVAVIKRLRQALQVHRGVTDSVMMT